MNALKRFWDWIRGTVKTVLMDVIESILDKASELTKDTELVDACINAIKAAAKEGLTGEKAWVGARDLLVEEMKKAGRELSDCALDTALQSTYAAWKSLGKPMD